MKKIIISLLVLSLVLVVTPATAKKPADPGLAASSGVDLFRGAWGGKMLIPEDPEDEDKAIQINLYFSESVPIDDVTSKASGYFSWDELGGLKRAKVSELPMMANITDLGEGTYKLFILANVLIPSDEEEPITTVMKLTGKAKMGGSGVADDIVEGQWYLKGPDGTLIQGLWSAAHLDRRAVQAPEVQLEDPTTNLVFRGDVAAQLYGPANVLLENRNPQYGFEVASNIVMDSALVTLPDGNSVIIPPFTDIFSPHVDFVTWFRFATALPGLPVAGGTYTFTGLDAAGQPIPGVETTDVWIGMPAPEPPTNLNGLIEDGRILMSWDPVDPVAGSFEPDLCDPELMKKQRDCGHYIVQVARVAPEGDDWNLYGAAGIFTTSHVIPGSWKDFSARDRGLPVGEWGDGTYRISVGVQSVAPEESGGVGWEYAWVKDHNEDLHIIIDNGAITIQQK